MPTFLPMDAPLESLLAQARRAAENAYAPYSGFRVGAALLLTNGETVTGTNVENASYGLTICAERSALVSAVSRFGPSVRIQAAAIANLNSAPSSPCGACRQVLAEFAAAGMRVAFPTAEGPQVLSMEELLPAGFALLPERLR